MKKISNISSMERFTTFVSNIANSIDPVLKSKLNGEKIIEDYRCYLGTSGNSCTPYYWSILLVTMELWNFPDVCIHLRRNIAILPCCKQK